MWAVLLQIYLSWAIRHSGDLGGFSLLGNQLIAAVGVLCPLGKELDRLGRTAWYGARLSFGWQLLGSWVRRGGRQRACEVTAMS